MSHNNPDNSAEPASMEFKQSCLAPSIQPDDVRDFIVNNKPAATQRYPECREFIREFDGRAPFGQVTTSTISISPSIFV